MQIVKNLQVSWKKNNEWTLINIPTYMYLVYCDPAFFPSSWPFARRVFIFCCKIISKAITVPLISKLPPLISWEMRRVLILQRCFWFLLRLILFLLRITEVLSIAYIMHKKSDMGNNNIVALQLIGNLMGWSNIRYMYALIVPLIHIEQTLNVRSDDYKALNLRL